MAEQLEPPNKPDDFTLAEKKKIELIQWDLYLEGKYKGEGAMKIRWDEAVKLYQSGFEGRPTLKDTTPIVYKKKRGRPRKIR